MVLSYPSLMLRPGDSEGLPRNEQWQEQDPQPQPLLGGLYTSAQGTQGLSGQAPGVAADTGGHDPLLG